MTDLGLRSRKGNKLTVDRFVQTLKNPAYVGRIPSKRYGPQKGLHEPLVSETMFRNVQLRLKGKKSISAPIQRNRPELPLRHFLRCAHCDSPLTGGPSKSHTGRLYFYYHCKECHAPKCIPAAKAEAQFRALLARLRPKASFTQEFTTVLRNEWAKNTGDSTVIVANLQRELTVLSDSQEKLLMKYVNEDPVIMPVFPGLNQKLKDKIASLEADISGARTAKATFEELLAFSRTMLVDLSMAWARADVDQRQRVQTALFPMGLRYDREEGILNPSNDSLFSQFLSGNVCMVDAVGIEPTTCRLRVECSTTTSCSSTY